MMNQNRLSFNEAKQIPIAEYLAGSGIEPAKIRGDDYWYYSPFREERTPSFKVSNKLNLWYDHGTGEGGTILDLGAKLHQCSLSEFLERLSDGNYTFSFHRQPISEIKPENVLEVRSVQELQNQDLLQYLKTRGISVDVASRFCKEVDFSIRDKAYKAIGFPNQSGAWELRNSWFKGSSTPKDISVLENGTGKLTVLEGFIDFLSLVQTRQKELQDVRLNSDFLILNSLRLLNRATPLLLKYKEINLLLDNDLAAREAKQNLTAKSILFKDNSSLYANHKDLNEFHVNYSKVKPSETMSLRKPRRMRR